MNYLGSLQERRTQWQGFSTDLLYHTHSIQQHPFNIAIHEIVVPNGICSPTKLEKTSRWNNRVEPMLSILKGKNLHHRLHTSSQKPEDTWIYDSIEEELEPQSTYWLEWFHWTQRGLLRLAVSSRRNSSVSGSSKLFCRKVWLLNRDTVTMGEFITGFLGNLYGTKKPCYLATNTIKAGLFPTVTLISSVTTIQLWYYRSQTSCLYSLNKSQAFKVGGTCQAAKSSVQKENRYLRLRRSIW